MQHSLFTEIISLLIITILVVTFLITNFILNKRKKKSIQLINENKPITTAPQRNTFTDTGGWVSLNWKTLSKSNEVQVLIKLCLENKSEWISEFDRKTFRKLHYMDAAGVLTLAYNFHNLDTDEDYMPGDYLLSLKQLASINSIIFNFKLPKSLWVLDSIVFQNVIRYLSLVEKSQVNYNEYKQSDFKFVKANTIKEFEIIKKGIPFLSIYISKIGTANQGPNIFILFDTIAKTNPVLYTLINKDITNLKRMLTMSYCLCGLDIPSDYVYMDENVYCFLTKKELLVDTVKE